MNIFDKFESRADSDFDKSIGVGLKINDNLLFINSAIIAVLISSDDFYGLNPIIIFLIFSSICSLFSLYFQKKLSLSTSIKFRIASILGRKALEEKKELKEKDFPSTSDLGDIIFLVNFFTNTSLLFFGFTMILVVLIYVL